MIFSQHQHDLLRLALAPITERDGGRALAAIEGSPLLKADHALFLIVTGDRIDMGHAPLSMLTDDRRQIEEMRRRSALGDIPFAVDQESQVIVVWLPREPARSA